MFQEDAVCLSTATLQGLRLAEIGRQHLQVQPLRMSSHPYHSTVRNRNVSSRYVYFGVDSNKQIGSGSEDAFDMSVSSM